MSKKPFFMRFVEDQPARVGTDVKAGAASGGDRKETTKAPSDFDEMVTMKYPSDDDEYRWEY